MRSLTQLGPLLVFDRLLPMSTGTPSNDEAALEAQCDYLYSVLAETLEEAGGSLADVVQLTTFTTRRENRKTVRERRLAWFGPQELPACSLIEVDPIGDSQVQVAMSAVARLPTSAESVDRLVAPELAPASGFAKIVRVGEFVFVAGQVARGADGRLIGPGDASLQTGQAFRQIGWALSAAGFSLDDLVLVTAYVTAEHHRESFLEMALQVVGGDRRPQITTYVVDGIGGPDAVVEVEAVARGVKRNAPGEQAESADPPSGRLVAGLAKPVQQLLCSGTATNQEFREDRRMENG